MAEEKMRNERQQRLDKLEAMLKEVYEKHGKEYQYIIPKKKEEKKR